MLAGWLTAYAAGDPPSGTPAPPAAAPAIRAADLLNPRQGWVLAGPALLWTENGGDHWREISPAMAPGHGIAAAFFLDPDHGWSLLVSGADPRSVTLARTTDGGASWQQEASELFVPGDPAAAAAGYALTFTDPQHGWLTVTRRTSSNFNRGALFATTDGGRTWVRRTLPAGGPAIFIDEQMGWTVGGPDHALLLGTQDGGVSWAAQALPGLDLATGTHRRVYLPVFAADRRTGRLAVRVDGAAGQEVRWYVTADGGAHWQPDGRLHLAAAFRHPLPLTATDVRAWLSAETGTQALPGAGERPYWGAARLPDGVPPAVLQLADGATGWALDQSRRQLARTTDGGQTWIPLRLPAAQAAPSGLPAPRSTQHGPRTPRTPLTAVVEGAGYDACELPALAALETWRTASPYKTVNLYIGGVMRACPNQLLAPGLLQLLAAQGWTFIPTWVGPQAPCSDYHVRFSLDPTTAFAQGQLEATAALAAAQALSLTLTDGSGTILYYDLESFDGSDGACAAAAQAFVSGWTASLHAAANLSGLYASACNPPLAAFAPLSAAPDAVWTAHWVADAYDPTVTVWDIACLGNELWNQSQRIRQYTGSHDETWGAITLNIDSNVLAGPVADLHPITDPVTVTDPVSVTVAAPLLAPPYAGDMCGSAWHQLAGDGGQLAYLTANRPITGPVPPITNSARWQPQLAASGWYTVAAYIPAHGITQWECPARTILSDTQEARYTIYYAGGAALRVADQAAAADTWLELGAYFFAAGNGGYVELTDETTEEAFASTISFGAMRFISTTVVFSPTATVLIPLVTSEVAETAESWP